MFVVIDRGVVDWCGEVLCCFLMFGVGWWNVDCDGVGVVVDMNGFDFVCSCNGGCDFFGIVDVEVLEWFVECLCIG